MVVWAVAGYFVARMLLDKTFRVFRCWKGAVAVVAVFIALFLVVGFDLTGYETRVPDPAQVASVEIGRLRSEPNDDGSFWYGVVTEDQEEIALVTQLHQAVVDHREVGERFPALRIPSESHLPHEGRHDLGTLLCYLCGGPGVGTARDHGLCPGTAVGGPGPGVAGLRSG